MKTKIICVIVMTLLITTALPALGILNDKEEYLEFHSNFQGVISEDWYETHKLQASDGTVDNWFGRDASIDGDYIIVGAPDKGADGGIYIYERTPSGWDETYNKDGHPDNVRFGFSVSINGEDAIIGDPLGTVSLQNEAGGAKIAHRDDSGVWSITALLAASDFKSYDHFGHSVSISGDYAVVSAPLDDDKGLDSGSAYVFVRSGTDWMQQAKLLASDGAAEDRFGKSVSIDDDTIIIGADLDDDNGMNSGSVYVFTRSGSTWTQQAKLLAPDAVLGHCFGFRVSLDGDTVLIGAIGDSTNGEDAGAVYVFTRSGSAWTQQTKFLSSDGTTGDWFGFSVSLDGNTALIGAVWDDDNGDSSGSAYIYTRSGTTWTEAQKLIASDAGPLHKFGWSVHINGDNAVIGSPINQSVGAVYVFKRNQSPTTPIITGPFEGNPNEPKTFNFESNDPEGGNLRYHVDWGDATSEWTGWFPSDTPVDVIHIYTKSGRYTITAYAEDESGLISPDGSFLYVCPRNKAVTGNMLLLRILERFPLLQKLLQQQWFGL